MENEEKLAIKLYYFITLRGNIFLTVTDISGFSTSLYKVPQDDHGITRTGMNRLEFVAIKGFNGVASRWDATVEINKEFCT